MPSLDSLEESGQEEQCTFLSNLEHRTTPSQPAGGDTPLAEKKKIRPSRMNV
jgi:hypothetical protein